MLPSGPLRTCCFICCAPTKQKLLDAFTREEASHGLSSISLHLLLGPKVKEALTLLDRLYICPGKCAPRFKKIAELQAQLTRLKLQVQVEAEAFGKDVLDSATTPGQDSNVWIKFRQHVIQNYVVGKLPSPSVNIVTDTDVCEIIEEKLNGIRRCLDDGIKREEETETSDESAVPEVTETGVVDISAAINNNAEADDPERQSRSRINLFLYGKPDATPSPEEDSDSELDNLFIKRPTTTSKKPEKEKNAASANDSHVSEPVVPGPSSKSKKSATERIENRVEQEVMDIVNAEEDCRGSDNESYSDSSESDWSDSKLFVRVKDLPKDNRKDNEKGKGSSTKDAMARKSQAAKLDEHLNSSDDSDGGSSLDDIFIKRPKTKTSNSQNTGSKQAKKSGIKRKADSTVEEDGDFDSLKDQDNLIYFCPAEICREEYETHAALSEHFFANHLSQAVKLYGRRRMFRCKKCKFSRQLTVSQTHAVNKDRDAGMPVVKHYLSKHVKVAKSKPIRDNGNTRPTKKTRASCDNPITETQESQSQERNSPPRRSPRVAKSSELPPTPSPSPPDEQGDDNTNPPPIKKGPPDPLRRSPRKRSTTLTVGTEVQSITTAPLPSAPSSRTDSLCETLHLHSEEKAADSNTTVTIKSSNSPPVKPVKSKPKAGPKSWKNNQDSKKSVDNNTAAKVQENPVVPAPIKQEPEVPESPESSNEMEDSEPEPDEDYDSKVNRIKTKRAAAKSTVVSLQRSPRCGPTPPPEPEPWSFKCPTCQFPTTNLEEYVDHAWDHKTDSEKTKALQERVGIDIPRRIRDDLIEKGRNRLTFTFRNEYAAEFTVGPGYREENYSCGVLPFEISLSSRSLSLQCKQCTFSLTSTMENKRKDEVIMITHYLSNHHRSQYNYM